MLSCCVYFCITGFLCSQEKELQGNYGLHDQVQTLKWVHRHIAQFRGDRNKVTIFGNSAGGGDVGLLSLAPPARGTSGQYILPIHSEGFRVKLEQHCQRAIIHDAKRLKTFS